MALKNVVSQYLAIFSIDYKFKIKLWVLVCFTIMLALDDLLSKIALTTTFKLDLSMVLTGVILKA